MSYLPGRKGSMYVWHHRCPFPQMDDRIMTPAMVNDMRGCPMCGEYPGIMPRGLLEAIV